MRVPLPLDIHALHCPPISRLTILEHIRKKTLGIGNVMSLLLSLGNFVSSLRLLWECRTSKISHRPFLSPPDAFSSPSFASFSISLPLQISPGPSFGFHSRALSSIASFDLERVWPSHLHFLSRICIFISAWPLTCVPAEFFVWNQVNECSFFDEDTY